MASQPDVLKAKVCLVGEHGVGKTSLIRRFVLDEFDDRYVVTLGAKVSKKAMSLSLPRLGTIAMDMTVWDVMGSKGFRELLREAYYHGASGILAACDLTRHDTLTDLDGWIEAVFRTVKNVPVVFVVNKVDLGDRATFGDREVRHAASAFDAPFFYTSAKTGQNVEAAFHALAAQVAARSVPE